jgi:hypothetical protein
MHLVCNGPSFLKFEKPEGDKRHEAQFNYTSLQSRVRTLLMYVLHLCTLELHDNLTMWPL